MANEMLTEVKFWSMVAEEGRRTIICSPEMESRVKGYLTARGVYGYHQVVVSPFCPDTVMYVMPLHRPPLVRRTGSEGTA